MTELSDVYRHSADFSALTQLNYYLYLLGAETDPEKKAEISGKAASLGKKLNVQSRSGGDSLFYLLVDSVLGLLVFPGQEVFDSVSKYTRPCKWQRDFPVLSGYVLSSDPEVFFSSFTYYSRTAQMYLREPNSPKTVLRHMRNSVASKKICFYPSQGISGAEEVTHLVFFDENAATGERFGLRIAKDDLGKIMLEISGYFINLRSIRARDSRTH